MFDQVSLHRARGPASGEAFLALISVLFHTAGFAAILAASYLTLNPLPLPPLKPYLVAPVFFPPAGAPAPLKGSGATPKTATGQTLQKEPTKEDLSQPNVPVVDPAPVPTEPSPSAEGTGAGSPDGLDDGSADGIPGGRCVGPDCDPNGPIGGGPGIPGVMGDPSEPGDEIHLPGINDVTEPVIDQSSRILPRYPEAARRAGVEGQVILQALINADGSVGSVQVLREVPPRIGFGPAAMEAVSKWRYRPGTLHGRAVVVQVTITVQFSLSR